MKKIVFLMVIILVLSTILTSCHRVIDIYKSFDDNNHIQVLQYVKEFDENWEYYSDFDNYEKICNNFKETCDECEFYDSSYIEKVLMITNDNENVYILISEGTSDENCQDMFWTKYGRIIIRNYQYFMLIKIGNCIIEAIRENSCEIVEKALKIEASYKIVNNEVQYYHNNNNILFSNNEYNNDDWLINDNDTLIPKKIKMIKDITKCNYCMHSAFMILERENDEGLIEGIVIYQLKNVDFIDKDELCFGYLFEYNDTFIFTNSYYFANVIKYF